MRKLVAYALLIFLALPLASVSAQEPFIANGKVTRVSDGDTILVDTGGDEWLEVRLYGVDCPESEWPSRWPAQPMSAEAKQFTTSLVAGKVVSVRLKEDTTYGRVVGEVFVDGKSLSRELLRAGLAWWNKKYEPWDLDLERLETAAKTARLGIWQDAGPIPPWVHRKQHQ